MRVLGILLAAGIGSRFEAGNKLLANLCGKPVVAHAGETLAAAHAAGHLNDSIVVLGHEAEQVRGAFTAESFEVVENSDYGEGQATSVSLGTRAARDRNADAVVFALGDLPCVSPETVERLVSSWGDSEAGIVVPTHDGKRGNPVLFDERHFEELSTISGDGGGRELFKANPVEYVAVDDPGIHRDVDTVADLEALRAGCE